VSNYILTHLDDDALLRAFAALIAQNCRTSAALIAYIAEIDTRHLYLRAGFESMRAYCMHVLHLTEDASAKRIQVARLARELPALFPALADGRLHLGAVRVLAPRLTPANVDELIAAAANRTISEIEVLLAHRFPQAEALRLDDGIAPQVIAPQGLGENSHAIWHASGGSAADPSGASLPTRVEPIEVAPKVRTKIAILSPERYTLQVTLPGDTHDKLRRAQALLGHAVPSGDVAQVLDRALDALLQGLEKRKYGLGSQHRAAHPATTPRCVPARVRRAVYRRDAGRCVHAGEDGRPCGSTNRIEFDHIVPVARGGRTTVANLRLLCRAHNRHEAERVLGMEVANRRRSASP
jgi:hypothetical protein